MTSPRLRLLLVVGAILALAACGSSSDADDGAGEEPTLERILTDAAAAMRAVETASFAVEQSGGEFFIDDTGQLAFVSAAGRFARPASSEALITVEALGFTTEIGAVAIDGELWFTNPLTGDWTEAPASFTFDPATLFDADAGLPALLAEAVPSAELIDDTSDEDRGERHHVRTLVGADRVSVLTGGLVTESSEVDLWIDADTSRITEARFDVPVDGGVSNWLLTLSDFDADVVIDPPELAG